MLKDNNEIKIHQYGGPLFIIGTGYSGTRYLFKLVNSVFGVRLVYKSDIIEVAYKIYKSRDVLANRSVFEDYSKKLKLEERGARSNTPLFKLSSSFYEELAISTLQRV